MSLTQDAWMVREQEANPHVFKDSVSCLEPMACSDASRTWTGRSDDNRTYSSNDTSTTSKDLLDASNFLVSHSLDAGRDLCTLATVLGRIPLLAVMDDIPCISYIPGSRRRVAQSVLELSLITPSHSEKNFWCFIGVGSEAT